MLFLASEADEVEVVKGAAQILACEVEPFDLFGEPFAHLDVVEGHRGGPVGPLADLQRRAFKWRVFVDPGQDLPVTDASGNLLLQSFGIDLGSCICFRRRFRRVQRGSYRGCAAGW